MDLKSRSAHIGYILLFLFSPLIIIAFSSLAINTTTCSLQPALDETRDVKQGSTLEQGFIACKPNLAGVGISIKNPQLLNRGDFTVLLLNDRREKQREVKVQGSQIADGALVRFHFDKIPDSKDKKYFIILSSDNTDKNLPYQIFISRDSNDHFLFNEEVQSGELSFLSYYQPESRLENLFGLINNLLIRLFNDRLFGIFYVLLITLTGIGIVSGMSKTGVS